MDFQNSTSSFNLGLKDSPTMLTLWETVSDFEWSSVAMLTNHFFTFLNISSK